MFKSKAHLPLLLITWLYQILHAAKGSRTLKTCPQGLWGEGVSALLPYKHIPTPPSHILFPQKFGNGAKNAGSHHLPRGQGQTSQPVVFSSRPLRGDAEMPHQRRMVFVHTLFFRSQSVNFLYEFCRPFAFFFFCFLPSVSPVKSNYLRCSRPLKQEQKCLQSCRKMFSVDFLWNCWSKLICVL